MMPYGAGVALVTAFLLAVVAVATGYAVWLLITDPAGPPEPWAEYDGVPLPEDAPDLDDEDRP